MNKQANVIGERFGRLTVIADVPQLRPRSRRVRCQCSCGNIIETDLALLRRGGSKSCGCLQKERASEANYKHGQSQSREHRIWAAMHTRCTNPQFHSYKYYGGKGIVICERWLGNEGFQNFLSDMGKSPSEIHTLDRIDANGNYEPGNCRWATPEEQSQNRTTNRFITYNGLTKTLSEWAREVGINRKTLGRRIYDYGWEIEDAMTKPVHKSLKA